MKKKLAALAAFFPWSLFLAPWIHQVLALADRLGHSLGICLGLQ